MKDINYVDIIDNIEEIEQIMGTTPRYRRCCYGFLELLKTLMASAQRLQGNRSAECRYNVFELCKVLINYVKNMKKSK